MVHTLVLFIMSLPLIFPKLVCVIFLECTLFLNGICFEAVVVWVFPILDVIAQRSDVDSPKQVKIFCSGWQGLLCASGILFGQGFVGGLFYGYFDFYKSCLLQSAIGTIAFILSSMYLVKNNFLRNVSVGSKSTLEDDRNEKTNLMVSKWNITFQLG